MLIASVSNCHITQNAERNRGFLYEDHTTRYFATESKEHFAVGDITISPWAANRRTRTGGSQVQGWQRFEQTWRAQGPASRTAHLPIVWPGEWRSLCKIQGKVDNALHIDSVLVLKVCTYSKKINRQWLKFFIYQNALFLYIKLECRVYDLGFRVQGIEHYTWCLGFTLIAKLEGTGV